MSYLVAVLRNASDADDVYGVVCESLWKGAADVSLGELVPDVRLHGRAETRISSTRAIPRRRERPAALSRPRRSRRVAARQRSRTRDVPAHRDAPIGSPSFARSSIRRIRRC